MRLVQACLVIVLVVLAFPGAAAAQSDENPDRLFDALGYAMFAGSAGDFLTTQHALSRGASELNPLQRDLGVRIATTAAFPLAGNYFTDELRNEHPKLALWIRIALVSLKGYAIVHNLRAAR